MAGDSAKTVKASATVGGSTVHPSGVTFVNSINNMAQGQVTYIHKASNAKSKATNITSSDIFSAMGQRQTNSFRDTPDQKSSTISMSDAYGGSMQLQGTTSAPSYSFSVAETALTEDIQPDYAALNCLDLTCYPASQQDLDKLEEEPPDSIPEFILELFKKLMKDGGKRIEEQLDGEATKQSAMKQHTINQKVKKYAEELFSNSKDTMGWDDAVKQLKEGGGTEQLRLRILTALTSRSGGFFNNIIRLAEEFQCVYVPEVDNVGKLVNRKYLFKSNDTLKVHIVSMSARAGSVSMFPVRGVAVVGVPLRADGDRVKSSDQYRALYPEDPAPGGTIMQVQGPQWLPSSGWVKDEIEEVPDGSKSKSVQKKGLPLKDAKTAEKVEKACKKQKKKKEDILKTWAENAYYWQALGQSYVILNTELNLKAEVGKRYRVQGDNGTIFTGILNSVNHSISTGVSQCRAMSNLQFSHVIMGSAKIPGID